MKSIFFFLLFICLMGCKDSDPSDKQMAEHIDTTVEQPLFVAPIDTIVKSYRDYIDSQEEEIVSQYLILTSFDTIKSDTIFTVFSSLYITGFVIGSSREWRYMSKMNNRRICVSDFDGSFSDKYIIKESWKPFSSDTIKEANVNFTNVNFKNRHWKYKLSNGRFERIWE